jgi:hypothetical protein
MSLRKKLTKMLPNPFFAKIINIISSVENVAQKFVIFFCYFQKSAQKKQSPNWRKFAQSGHPAQNVANPLI